MILRFEEDMHGVTADGRKLVFRLHVEAPKVRSMLLARELRLEGTVDLETVAERASVTGTLVVGMPWQRVMHYELAFTGTDGARYRFVGKKNVRYTSPRETLTTLAGAIEKDGAHFVDATVSFRWRDLPQFLGSFRLAGA